MAKKLYVSKLSIALAASLLGAIVWIVLYRLSSDDIQPSILFSVSISASFDIETKERKENDSGKSHLKIEWNPTTEKINFHQTEIISSDINFESFAIKADGRQTIGFSHMNITEAFCVEDVSPPQWVGIIEHIASTNNWRRAVPVDRCHGNVWYTYYKGNITEICSNANQLQYVTHQNSRAEVATWTKTEKQNIHIRSDVLNGQCRNISQANYKKQHKPRKIKRDSKVLPITCLFVHGSGNVNSGNTILPDLTEYWGDVRDYTPKCSTHKFLNYNSRDYGWDADNLHQTFCDAAAPNGTINNTVIFSHSMGNLVVAAALHRNNCTFNQTTSRWFSVQGLWSGTVAANYISEICRSYPVLGYVFQKLGWYCKETEGSVFNVYSTLSTDYISPTGVTFANLTDVGRKFVSGVMCGMSSWGQMEYFFESWFLSKVQDSSHLGEPNDGMVSFDSCNLKNESFDKRTSQPYYAAKINHADGTCKNGGDPCMWYYYMQDYML